MKYLVCHAHALAQRFTWRAAVDVQITPALRKSQAAQPIVIAHDTRDRRAWLIQEVFRYVSAVALAVDRHILGAPAPVTRASIRRDNSARRACGVRRTRALCSRRREGLRPHRRAVSSASARSSNARTGKITSKRGTPCGTRRDNSELALVKAPASANVFSPKDFTSTKKRRPAIVWSHGGAGESQAGDAVATRIATAVDRCLRHRSPADKPERIATHDAMPAHPA